MKRLLAFVAVVLAAALLAPGLGSAKSKAHTYNFTGIVKASDLVLIDVKGDGPSPGDVYTFTATTFDKTGKHQVAKGHGYCVLNVPQFATCTSISNDGKGKIVTSWEDDNKASTKDEVAITGGTRRYRNLRGDGLITPTPGDPTTFKIKLHGSY